MFLVIGLVLVLLELIIGVEAGLDLVFVGSAFILGGLIGWPLQNWIAVVVITSVICIVYIILGRKYIHRLMLTKKSKTNIDSIIGKRGLVLRGINKNDDGIVKIGNEQWSARADIGVHKGEEIVVTGISGVTLLVQKANGGD
jgi:membrane protein implicated in regulation of membrane protease activity